MRNFTSVFFFCILIQAIAGCGANNLFFLDSINPYRQQSDSAETRKCLVKNDGERIYGQKIIQQHLPLSKPVIKIDGQKFDVKEIKGYYQDGRYFGRLDDRFMQRIIRGRLNVYLLRSENRVATTDSRGFTSYNTVKKFTYYTQKGDDAEMIPLYGYKEFLAAVADCPAAYAMVNSGKKELEKRRRQDIDYYNKVFETYNNGCGPLR